MGTVRKVKLGDILRQYRIECWVVDNEIYKQVTITKDGNVFVRGEKIGSEIGRKRQFVLDLEKYPDTLLFIRQTIWDGGIGIASKEVHGCIVTENFPMFSISEGVLPAFLSHFFRTFDFIQKLSQISTKGSAQQALHERDFLKIELNLPDLATQKAIVARLQSLQSLHREADAILARLRADVKRLRQSILQEAIQGKLVDYKPAPGEKTGGDLLADIRAEKDRRAREAGKKLEAPLPPVTSEEMPFEVPEGWVWCRLGEIAFVTKLAGFEFTEYFDLKTTGEVPVVRAQNVKPHRLEKSNLLYISKEISEHLWRSELTKPCLLITFIGAGIGEVAPFEENERWHLAPNVAKAEMLHHQINLKFLLHFLLSDEGKKQLFKHRKQTSQPSLSMESIRDAFIPLPPDIEQDLIVKAIETRLAQCDHLEQQLATLQTKTERLWKSELQQTFKFENAG